MKRFILTGTPGSGKTSILRILAAAGYLVVDEAATDVMAARLAAGSTEPWTDPIFIERIALLQRHRREETVSPGAAAQVHDRSAVCTLALAHHLGHPVPPVLAAEIARITEAGYFDRQVFFVRPLGFLQPTEVRRISYEESLAFERRHETEYQRLGFEIVDVPVGPVAERAAAIDAHIRSWALPATAWPGVMELARSTGAPPRRPAVTGARRDEMAYGPSRNHRFRGARGRGHDPGRDGA